MRGIRNVPFIPVLHLLLLFSASLTVSSTSNHKTSKLISNDTNNAWGIVTVEEEVELVLPLDPELHRRILGGGKSIDVKNAGRADKPACGNSCSGRGQPYTQAHCAKYYNPGCK
jgi:hypothetical protein